jgi:DNA-binding IclR family transcriptional regulator
MVNVDMWKAELERIQEKGYCLASDDYEVGAFAVGAPIWDHRSQVVAVISTATPMARDTAARWKELVAWVVAAADELSRKLGHEGGSVADEGARSLDDG